MAQKSTAQKSTAQKKWEKMTLKEKMDRVHAELTALTQKLADIERRIDEERRSTVQNVSRLSENFADIERRLDEGRKSAVNDASRMTKTLSEFNVRLSSVAANVLEVSAVAARAEEMADRSQKKSSLWANHDVAITR